MSRGDKQNAARRFPITTASFVAAQSSSSCVYQSASSILIYTLLLLTFSLPCFFSLNPNGRRRRKKNWKFSVISVVTSQRFLITHQQRTTTTDDDTMQSPARAKFSPHQIKQPRQERTSAALHDSSSSRHLLALEPEIPPRARAFSLLIPMSYRFSNRVSSI